MEEIEVECTMCDTVFLTPRDAIEIDLDEWWSDDDYGFYHIYRTECRICNERESVFIVTEGLDCCTLT